MGNGIFGIGVSGLNAAQAGLVTTGHNIANASTPGFHRQNIIQSNAFPVFTGAGFFGQGVNVETVQRVYSQFLDGQVVRTQAQSAYLTTYQSHVAQIDNLLADPAAGLTPALQEFFQGVHNVAANPASAASRQTLLAQAEALVARFQTIDQRLEELGAGVNSQLTATVGSINSYAREIARLNGRIVATQIDPAQPPNDLLDKRDQLIAELNQLIGTTSVTQSDGSVNVFVGSGQNLVVGQQAFSLATIASIDDPRRLDIAYVTGGAPVAISAANLRSGSVGGLLDFRASTLEPARDELGRVAAGLARSFNDQHRLGQDIDGAPGGDFFVVPQPGVVGRTTNTGTATFGAAITDAAGLTASNYRLVFSGGSYQLTRLSDNTTTAFAALPQTVDGFTISLTGGAPANGDAFLIEPTRYAARDIAVAVTDGSRIAAAAPMRTAAGAGNSGSGAISAGSVNAPPPPNANLQQLVTITFTGAGTFNVNGTGTGNPAGVAYVPGAAITYNGWTVSISGTPAAGDTFTVSANTGGRADNRNALLLADLQTASTLIGGTASYQSAYGGLVGAVGAKTHEIDVSAQAQETMLAQAREQQQSLSGVNLDEEAANLLRYQQAYQAAGKLIAVAATLFDTLLELGG